MKAADIWLMAVCILSPLRLHRIHVQQLLTLHWRSFSRWGKECVSVCFDQQCGQFIQKRQRHTKANILWLRIAYQNVTNIVKPETQKRRLDVAGLAKPSKTPWLPSTGSGLSCQEAAGQDSGRVWIWTDPLFQSKPGLLAGYQDLVLTLGGPGGHDHVNSMMHSRPQWRGFGDSLAGLDWARFQEYLEVVDLEVVNLEVVNLEVVNLEAFNQEGDNLQSFNLESVNWQCTGCWESIDRFHNSRQWKCHHDEVTLHFSSQGELAGGGRSYRQVSGQLKLHPGVNM